MKNNQSHSGMAINLTGLLMMILLAPALTAGAQDPFMQYPDIQGNIIVFASGGDLWKVPAEGGTACRLTFSDGRESVPEISPDGSLIAFTGEYDGNADVYIMNIDGGNITRLTWHPGTDEVVGWNAVKNKIMFTSGRNSPSRYVKMYLVSPDGTGLEEMIMYDAARGSFSPDGTKIAYNKDSQDNATWNGTGEEGHRRFISMILRPTRRPISATMTGQTGGRCGSGTKFISALTATGY